ncbi:hypothetical protein [uncultured Pseudodesulfovibrio sp.]|uniref:hypothetical protein n=1 Tax=uncultured Pseudodesulfovibrio sp. TaxID=2035858 RepID=UPI0029C7A9B4|nr:hypothetical protein [uncultured Pseudodesulfovibrio sp.]
MTIQNEIRIGTPHDHGNYAMSKMGSIFIGLNDEGKRTLMCLECGTTWTIEDGKAPAGYSVCPAYGCNSFFKYGITPEAGPAFVLSRISNLWRPFTTEGEFMNDCLGELYRMLNDVEPLRCIYGGPHGIIEISWEDHLEGILENIAYAKVKPGHFGTGLALNTIRHYVAHLWKWFEHEEEVAGIEDAEDHEAVLAKAPSFADATTLDAEAHPVELNMVLDKIDSFKPTDEAGMGLKAFFVECRERRDALRQ